MLEGRVRRGLDNDRSRLSAAHEGETTGRVACTHGSRRGAGKDTSTRDAEHDRSDRTPDSEANMGRANKAKIGHCEKWLREHGEFTELMF